MLFFFSFISYNEKRMKRLGLEKIDLLYIYIYIYIYIYSKKCKGSFGKTCGPHSIPRIAKQLINGMR